MTRKDKQLIDENVASNDDALLNDTRIEVLIDLKNNNRERF